MDTKGLWRFPPAVKVGARKIRSLGTSQGALDRLEQVFTLVGVSLTQGPIPRWVPSPSEKGDAELSFQLLHQGLKLKAVLGHDSYCVQTYKSKSWSRQEANANITFQSLHPRNTDPLAEFYMESVKSEHGLAHVDVLPLEPEKT